MLSSIILAVVLIVVIISMGITKLVKSARRKSAAQNENRYDARRKRYIKRLNLQTEEDEEEEEPSAPAQTETPAKKNEIEDPYQD
jgi:Sec-independent protein translocase protein TatA